MYSFIKTAAFAALALLASANAAEEGGHDHDHDHGYKTGVDCKPCADSTGDCEVIVKINFFASETGYFAIDGCEGVNPTLHLTVGRTYLFDQTDDSNWYHLIGFAYEADGAHVAVDELEPGIAPGDSDCAETLSCPAPMYWMAGNYTGVYSNNPSLVDIPEEPSDDFGLDVVEPLFFHPLGEWQGYGEFVTSLNFDTTFDQDIFYFCHVHAGMSARIKLLDADGNMLNTENTPEIPYEYAEIDDFDFKCGTYNLTDYEDVEPGTCPEVFVCENGATKKSQYAECVQAMNCHMMASMTTNAVGRSALFCHQMIPHHQNAVNMAKALIHAHDFACDLSGPAEEGAELPWECELSPILYDIINVQNSQIIDMQGALEQLGENEYENCEVEFQAPGSMTEVSKRRLAEPDFMKHGTQRKAEECAFASGVDCKPCDGTDGDCIVEVKVNLLAGETGYYEIVGCEGVNPTLHLEVGRTYLFDQSDKSNWYHLIGFAYEADGAHVGVDELEPGIAPGDSDCGDTFSCPAPMYWMNGEYTGVYSNIESLEPVTGDEDFGLDVVEPLFFLPLADWEEKGSFVTALNFDDENFDEDIFYFCHVHSLMTGRIKLIGSDGSMKSEANTPEIPYSYDCVSSFDGDCGTFGTDQFKLEDNPQCPDRFVCFDGAGTIGEMAECINAMNCAMLTGMTVFYGDEGKDEKLNDTILFLREMIPHHQNAVNMAKNLLKSGEVNCSLDAPVEEGEEVSTACLLDPIVRGIINTQNSQIQAMYGLLDTFDVDYPEKKICTISEDGSMEPMEDGSMESDASGVESLLGVSVALLAGLAL